MNPTRFSVRAVLLILCVLVLEAKSVKLIRVINLREAGGEKSLGSVLFGARPARKIIPSGLCLLGGGRYALTDTVHGTVYILNGRGAVEKALTQAGDLKLSAPVGVCADDEGRMYVADSGLARVVRFDRRARFETSFSAPDQGRITGIVFRGGTLFGTDTANHRVCGFDKNGRPTIAFGRRGTKEGEFNFPTHIAADADFLYVTDAMNFRIQVFDHGGRFVGKFGTPGTGGGNFSKPKGLAVDSRGRIFVADAMFDNVQVFDVQGRFLHYFGGPGHADGEFWMPSGMMVDGENALWVADAYNNRLQVFRVEEEQP